MNRYLYSRTALLASILAAGIALTACGKTVPPDGPGDDPSLPSSLETSVTPDTIPDVTFPTEAVSGTYEAAGETIITLCNVDDEDAVTCTGEGATVEGHVVTVTRAGSYLISGSLNDGQIVVDTTDEEKVVLLLNGVSLNCTDGPAIFVKEAPKKVVIETVLGSANLLSDGTDYVVPDESQVEGEVYPNACIYACDDLTFKGEGKLFITGNADKGVNTKDDLKIKGGTLVVSSVGVGLRGNDSVTVSDGSVTIVSGGDGIKSANTEKEGKGTVTVEGGALYITATGDGLSAATDMTVSGGTLVITTKDTDNGNGSNNGNGNMMPSGNGQSGSGQVKVTMATSSDRLTMTDLRGFGGMPGGGGGGMPGGGGNMPGGGGNMPGGGGMFEDGNNNKSTISAKGLKAAGTLTVSGGKITIDAADDGLHSNDTVLIQGGQLHISTADDGIHADKVLTVSGGVTEIAESYEGMEANQLTISGGTNRINASDDGLNANGGTSMGMGMGGGMWGGFPGGNTSGTDTDDGSSPLLTISGGYTVIYAAGDGIDSNGNIVMTDGTLYVYGPTDNGNGAIDYGDGNYSMTISGGTLLAVGSSGMAETAQNNGQAVLTATTRTGISAGTVIGIKDADGHIVAAFVLPKAISSIVYSSPALTSGSSYTVVYGGTAGDATDGVVSDLSSYTGYSTLCTATAK